MSNIATNPFLALSILMLLSDNEIVELDATLASGAIGVTFGF